MIDFKPIALEDKALYEQYLSAEKELGCNYSFANLFLWGKQNIAFLHNHIVLFSQFNNLNIYPYPLGFGDKKLVLDAIIADAKERNIPCKISCLCADEQDVLEVLYPKKFQFFFDRDSSDYVYAIDDLADLKGRKYHRKRNHYNGFLKNFPNYRVEPLTTEHIPSVQEFIHQWYESKLIENPKANFQMEQQAIKKALSHYNALKMEGLILFHESDIFAITLGSRLSSNTFDVHFEKAKGEVNGAYAAINCEFARYIRNKYPEIQFLNREEDMGIPGLRKAKESYYPHHMAEKYWAILSEDTNENSHSA
ncbi:MAG: DUF2156 domain-containing protein [Lachnospiraceae bacterium]|nr:DUF2156 domain-containing protein [Lachnospiraceae bacterium]